MPAIRTLFGDGFRRRSEFALRIISAAVKSISLARALFNEFAFFAFGTLYANEVLLHVFALGISGAGHELAEAPALQDHDASTVFAVFLLRGLLYIGRIEVGKINGILFGELAGVGVLLVVGAAGIERTVLAPLNNQRSATELTLFVGGFLHALDVFHVLLGVSEILGKLLVKLGERVVPGLLAFFNLIELLFQARGVLEVKN